MYMYMYIVYMFMYVHICVYMCVKCVCIYEAHGVLSTLTPANCKTNVTPCMTCAALRML